MEECCNILSRVNTCEWRPTSEKSLWISQRLLQSVVGIIKQRFTPSQWTYYSAKRNCEPSPVAKGYNDLCEELEHGWIDDLIYDKRIRMMFQPIVDMTSGYSRIAAYELLARGLDTHGSIISPIDLFSAAKKQNRLLYLDSACRLHAVEAASKLRAPIKAFINFVPSAISTPNQCLQSTFRAAQQSNLDPSQIVFEIVETEKIVNIHHIKAIMRIYRELGVQYALDDVGQGHNTIDLIHILQPDIVKLDREITSQVHESAQALDMANKVRKAAEKYGALCLAEGIETEEQSKALLKAGYFWHQGYYYGKPQWEPLDDSNSRQLAKAA